MIIGIDPGVNGGIAILRKSAPELGPEVITTLALTNLTESEVAEWFVRRRLPYTPSSSPNSASVPCFIERVGYIKGDGAMGSFTFGRVYGLLRGLARGNEWGLHDVYPAVWQARLGCLTGGNKNVTKNKARELFPLYNAGLKYGITHAIADALLIAEYGRRKVSPLPSK